MSTYGCVDDMKTGCSPAAGCARLVGGRWESCKEARRAYTAAIVTFAGTVLLQRQGTIILVGVLYHLNVL